VTDQSAASEFDAAVLALLDAVASGGAFGERDLQLLTSGLGRFVSAAYGSLDRDERAEVVSESLLSFISAAQARRIDRAQRPAAYLTRIASNAAVDALRRRQREDPERDVEGLGEDDAALQATLDRLTGQARIVRLMRAAMDSGEHDLVRLMRAFRDMSSGGATPTLRQLGAKLGTSHTEVRRQLDRLAQLEDGT
jgi:DNA-directed RNA polymerase specialized sigma24 family protein